MKIIGNTVGTTMNPKKFGGTVTNEQITQAVENYMTEHPVKGEKGDTGGTGPAGPQGEPGYTPVKGVDYFDGEDQKVIVNAVLDALTVAEGVSF